jgi:hypothetical protein
VVIGFIEGYVLLPFGLAAFLGVVFPRFSPSTVTSIPGFSFTELLGTPTKRFFACAALLSSFLWASLPRCLLECLHEINDLPMRWRQVAQPHAGCRTRDGLQV